MAKMVPCCVNDQAVDELIDSAGRTGERLLYKLMRDHLPDDWCVIWNRRVANPMANRQCDFIVLVPNMGVLTLDAKGHGYGYNQGVLGCWVQNVFHPDPELFNNVQGAQKAVMNDLRMNFGEFGACNCLVAFIDPFDNENAPNAFDWVDNIEVRINQDNDYLKNRIIGCLSQRINGLDLTTKHQYFTPAMMDKIKNHFAGKNGWQQSFQDDFYKWESESMQYLSSRQRAIATQARNCPAMHIKGAAGTGKTIIAIELAKHFAKQGQRVLYVCFNRKLADYLNRKKNSGHWKNIVITNYDAIGSISLAAFNNVTLNNRLGRNIQYRNGWTADQWKRERTNIADCLFNPPKNRSLDNFDVLIIDEAQDLDNRCIGSLFCLRKENGKTFIFSDENQSIYSTNWSLDREKLFPGIQLKEMELRENWRNTTQIHEHFQPIVDDQSTAMLEGDLEVIIIMRGEVQQCINGLLSENGRSPRNIALLSIGGASMDEFTQARNTRSNQTFNIIRDDMNGWYDDRCILKTSVEGFKGLDSDIVFLFGDTSLGKDNPLYDHREQDRYVGESRAKYELYLVEE